MKLSVVIPIGEKRKMYVDETLENQDVAVKSIVEIGPNPSANRNRGSRKAKTELVAFVNAHTILPRNWSKKVIDFFEKYPEIDIVGGPQLTDQDSSFFERVSGHALGSIFAMANLSQRYRPSDLNFDADEKHLTSANLICRKEVLDKIEFDENVWPGEDPKFILDAKERKFKVAYSPDIVVSHRRRDSLGGLWKQIFNYGYRRTKNLRGTVFGNPLFFVPSLFILYLLFLPTLVLFNKMLLIPLAAYFIFI